LGTAAVLARSFSSQMGHNSKTKCPRTHVYIDIFTVFVHRTHPYSGVIISETPYIKLHFSSISKENPLL
jgi:hypothetical protein